MRELLQQKTQSQPEFGIDTELFQEYCHLLLAMSWKKKTLQYDELTKQIETTHDESRIVSLSAERAKLNYQLQPPDGMLPV